MGAHRVHQAASSIELLHHCLLVQEVLVASRTVLHRADEERLVASRVVSAVVGLHRLVDILSVDEMSSCCRWYVARNVLLLDGFGVICRVQSDDPRGSSHHAT